MPSFQIRLRGAMLSALVCFSAGCYEPSESLSLTRVWEYRTGFEPGWLQEPSGVSAGNGDSGGDGPNQVEGVCSEQPPAVDWQTCDFPLDFWIWPAFQDYRGHVTLRARLPGRVAELAAKGRAISFFSGQVSDVARYYLNGREFGGIGSERPYENGAFRRLLSNVPVDYINRDGPNDLAIVLYTTGEYPLFLADSEIRIGSAAAVYRWFYGKEILSTVLLGIYFVFGLYHLLLAIRRPGDLYNLYFGVFCVSVTAYWIFRLGSRDLLFGAQVMLRTKIELVSLFALAPLLALFLTQFFQRKHWWPALAISGWCGLLALLVILAPNYAVTQFGLRLWQFSALALMMPFNVGYIIWRTLRRESEAYYLLAGMLALMTATTHDMLAAWGILNTPHIATYVFPLFIIGIAGLLANRFVRVQNRVEELNANLEELNSRLEVKVEERTRELGEAEQLVEYHTSPEYFEQQVGDRKLVCASPLMRGVIRKAVRFADLDRPALVTGETGTGKELIARAMHYTGERSAGPFVPVNCAAVPTALWESEIFGHVRGAFTDARQDRSGRVAEAGGGSLFFDEIGEMPLDMQAKMLRLLQERQYRPIGADATHTAECRFIFATNRDLEAMIAEGGFREDLYYRINVFHVHIPPLRERSADIPILIRHLLEDLAAEDGTAPPSVTGAALAALTSYPWPGNIRELENVLTRAVAGVGLTELDIEHLARVVVLATPRKTPAASPDIAPALAARPKVGGKPVDFDALVQNYSRQLIEAALLEAEGNKTKAAELLSMKRSRLRYQLKEMNLD